MNQKIKTKLAGATDEQRAKFKKLQSVYVKGKRAAQRKYVSAKWNTKRTTTPR